MQDTITTLEEKTIVIIVIILLNNILLLNLTYPYLLLPQLILSLPQLYILVHPNILL